MFNAKDGVCDNRYIDLAFGYNFDGIDAAQISHRLFLLKEGDQDSYQLECDVKVCDNNDGDSDCNEWTACLESDNHSRYVCADACEDGYECEVTNNGHAQCEEEVADCEGAINDWSPDADDVVIGLHSQGYSGLTQLNSNFLRSAAGGAFLNRFQAHHNSFGIRAHTVGACVTCSSDNQNIAVNGVTHMATSNEDLSSGACSADTSWRPKMCSMAGDSSCSPNWNSMTENSVYTSYCTTYNCHGIFVKTDVYDRIAASCEFTQIRMGVIGDGGDGEDPLV